MRLLAPRYGIAGGRGEIAAARGWGHSFLSLSQDLSRGYYSLPAVLVQFRALESRQVSQLGEAGLRAADDTQVAAAARAEGRAAVTENVADFAAERDLVVVFVLQKNLPAGGGQAAALARILDRWKENNVVFCTSLGGPMYETVRLPVRLPRP